MTFGVVDIFLFELIELQEFNIIHPIVAIK
jgi:hypothetical protein